MTILTKEQVAAYRNTSLCDVHQDAWIQIICTIDHLYAKVAALEMVEDAVENLDIEDGNVVIHGLPKLRDAMFDYWEAEKRGFK
jgi:hypothetical protein